MIARRIFAWRPTETPSKRMLSSTRAQLLTRTFGERIDLSTRPPEMIDPAETMLASAMPARGFELPSNCANTNFGGGDDGWYVRISQAWSYRLSCGSTETRSMFAS